MELVPKAFRTSATLQAHSALRAVAFDPEGRWLATGTVVQRGHRPTLGGGGSAVAAAATAAQGCRGGIGGIVQLWDLRRSSSSGDDGKGQAASAATPRRIELVGHSNDVCAVAWDYAGGGRLATAGDDRTVRESATTNQPKILGTERMRWPFPTAARRWAAVGGPHLVLCGLPGLPHAARRLSFNSHRPTAPPPPPPPPQGCGTPRPGPARGCSAARGLRPGAGVQPDDPRPAGERLS